MELRNRNTPVLFWHRMYQGWNAVLFLVMDARERSPWSDAVAAQIRAERAAAGLTQVEMARKIQMPRVSYLRIENGTRVADISQVARIAAGFGLSAVEFMQRAQERLERDGRSGVREP